MEIKKIHEWEISIEQAICLQASLASQIQLSKCVSALHYVAGVDISHNQKQDLLFAAVVILDIKNLQVVETVTHSEEATYPYVSGLLSFREIPPLLKAFAKLSLQPQVVICDGHGISHPRKMGIAAHLGLWLNIPTIGCAKTRLVGDFEQPELEKGSVSPLVYKNQIVGSVLRSKKNVRPLFISPGHLIDLEGSVEVVKKCLAGFRLPEPTRQAHLAANRLRVEISSLNR